MIKPRVKDRENWRNCMSWMPRVCLRAEHQLIDSSKCKVMHFGIKKNKKLAYTMLDSDLNRRSLTESNLKRGLDILFSNNLIWEDQVNSAVSKASRS